MSHDLILGTAGHIDHGKTALVRALTGVDTDRLPEEKKRGITIELGFARLVLDDIRLGIVDVPGHERFVRNMLAGATSVDLAMLVVAADDSVKPQTREHLEILKLLDLRAGVVALSKCDLADPDWIDMVEAEVRDLVAGTFLADAPIVRTSAHTGAGLDELRDALRAAARRVVESTNAPDMPPTANSSNAAMLSGESKPSESESTQAEIKSQPLGAESHSPFRMAVDRVFTIAGHGTVVTGSVQSGAAHLGDELVLQPGGITVRVRGLQNHDTPVDQVSRGQRAAVNLGGVRHDEIARGQELASSGHLVPSQILSVRLRSLPSASRPLKNRSRVRVHLGAAEAIASVTLLEQTQLAPGESSLAQLFLGQPVVAVWNQPFVIRSQSPIETIGGGQVLDPTALKIRPRDAQKIDRLRQLADGDPLSRASASLYFAGLRGWRPADLARGAGVLDVGCVAAELAARGELQHLRLSPTRTSCVHSDVLEEIGHQLEQALARLQAARPLERTIDKSQLLARFDYLGESALLEAVLEQRAAAGCVVVSERGVALPGRGPQLSKPQQRLLEDIVERHRQSGLQPPLVSEIQKQTANNQAAVPQLCRLAVAEGRLVDLSGPFYLHRDVYDQLRHDLAAALSEHDGLTLSEIRQFLGTSRKFAVPICEHFDRIGFTRRDGDRRYLGESSRQTAE